MVFERQKPLGWELLKFLFWSAVCVSAFTGCATKLYSPTTGKPLLSIPADATGVAYSGAGVTFTVQRLSHSTVARANWKGWRDLASVLGSDVVAVLVPGSGAAPLVGKAAIATLPHIAVPKDTKPGE